MDQGLIRGIYRSLVGSGAEPAQQDLVAETRARLGVARDYVRTYTQARRQPDPFRDVHTYCLFLGHARSGSTLLGALLDAHPNAIIADEVNIFPYLSAGFQRDQVFHLLLARSRQQADKGRTKPGRDAKEYSYRVPGQWQGRSDGLLVLGNRKAGISTQAIGRNPDLLHRWQQRLGGVRLKLITSIRNPYDTISTMNIRGGKPLEDRIEQYFANCETIRWVRDSVPAEDFLVLRHEAFLADPEVCLRQMCRFLGLEAFDDYVQACSSVLYPSPAQTRYKIKWSPDLIRRVETQLAGYDFLAGYTFDE